MGFKILLNVAQRPRLHLINQSVLAGPPKKRLPELLIKFDTGTFDSGVYHGSYLVFPTESEKLMAALVTEKAFPILPVAAAAASALVILLGVIGFAIRRAKRKKARFDAENIK